MRSQSLPQKSRKTSFPTKEYNVLLTRKQRLFVNYYLAGQNSYRSALKAGYTESVARTASLSILRNPNVFKEIKTRERAVFEQSELSAQTVLEHTAKMATSNMLDYIEVEENGTFKVDLTKVDRDLGVAIQELSYDQNGRVRIRLADKKGSLEMLARFYKMFGGDEDPDGKEKPVTVQYLDALIQQVVTVNQTTINIGPQEKRGLPSGSDSIIEGKLTR